MQGTDNRPVSAVCCLPCVVQFMEWSRCVCDKLQEQGYWCDFIDPCSGLPVSPTPCSCAASTPLQSACLRSRNDAIMCTVYGRQ
jgi:hypothetical protein